MKNNTATSIKQKRIKKLLHMILFIVICGGIGYVIGFLSATYFKSYINAHIKSDNTLLTMLRIYGLIFIFFFGFIFHIIIHEAGHLLFGLFTGYSFVSFRVGSHTFVKEDNKLRYKRFNLPGTGGQCLMMPPPLKDGSYPFVIYNLGGVIMNLVTAAAGILAVILMEGITYPIDATLILVSFGGLLTALLNGIPLKISGVSNDAHNVLSMLKDMDARNAFYTLLKINGLQSQGTRIKELPLEMFKLKENSDLCNPLNTGFRLLEYNWFLDNMDFENARKCIESLTPYLGKLLPYYKNEINCERIFLELVGTCDKAFIDDLYDDSLKKYIKAAKFMLNKKRMLMAYEGFYNEDREKALEHYEAAKSLARKYPVKGEAELELMLIDWMKEKLQI